MAQFIVRDLEDDVKERLKRRAARHRRSMEEEIRHILRNAVKGKNLPSDREMNPAPLPEHPPVAVCIAPTTSLQGRVRQSFVPRQFAYEMRLRRD